MICNHEIYEMDTAAHSDGLCPLCLKADNERLRKQILLDGCVAEITAYRNDALEEAAKIADRTWDTTRNIAAAIRALKEPRPC